MKAVFLTSYGNEGYGHIFRCIGLSEAFEKIGISTKFIVKGKDPKKLLKLNNILQIIDWYKNLEKTISLIKNYNIVIVDSSRIKKKNLILIKKNIKNLIYINDFCRWKINDVLHVDWTLFAKKKINKNELIDHKYCVLRKNFWNSKSITIKQKIKKILIFFGGSDVRKLSTKILGFLKYLNYDYKITIISKNIRLNKKKNIKIKKFLDGIQIKKEMLNSDIAITSGGQTLYELARLGLPSLVFSETIFDKEDIVAWKKKGTIIYVGNWNEENLETKFANKFKKISSHKTRKKMSRLGKKIIDGKGALRLAKKIKLYAEKNLQK